MWWYWFVGSWCPQIGLAGELCSGVIEVSCSEAVAVIGMVAWKCGSIPRVCKGAYVRIGVEIQPRTARPRFWHRISPSSCPIELSFAELPAEIQADERLLQHIFTNLLTNAVKYSDAGRAVRFEIESAGAEIVCVIKDEGIGIPEADRDWPFNAFHRGQNVADRPGTGLGLVIVKRCVNLHRGTIQMDSKFGKGTVVTVRLPT